MMELYPRQLETEILKNLSNERALFILGARRTGKTSLLNRLRRLIPSDSRSILMDFEDPDMLSIVRQGVKPFLAYLKGLGLPPDQKVYVFMDEIQYLKDFSSFIKLLVDHHSDRIKLILSGSSAAQIKVQFKDSLVGRKLVYELYPLNFREFLVFKGKNSLVKLLGTDRNRTDKESLIYFENEFSQLYNEFMIFGGFPEVVLTEDFSGKKLLLREMVRSYIMKDIRNIFQIEKIDSFNNVLKMTAAQVGQLLNISSLARDCRTTRITVEKYVNILEDTYIIRRISPLFNNKKKELKRMPKAYFLDTGLRNYLITNFTAFDLRIDKGQLLENSVFASLWKSLGVMEEIFFWHTADDKEVDFILRNETDYYPFEVKMKRTAINHLKRFSELYHCPEMNLVRYRSKDVKPVSGINIIPPWIL